MVILTIGLGYFVRQHEFWKIISLYVPLLGLYCRVCRKTLTGGNCFLARKKIKFFSLKKAIFHLSAFAQTENLGFWIALAICLRLVLLFSIPNLSNDVYRFIWDGRLLVHGHNPFEHLPLFYLENQVNVPGIDRALFEAFGSKNTFSSYPPVAQAQFASACWLFPNDVLGAVVVMKLWLLACEVGTIFLALKLLRRFGLPEKNVLWYALNPLILLEIMGNLHFEGAMIFFLLLAFWLLASFPKSSSRLLSGRKTDVLSAIAFALSVCSKLLTLLFLPFLIKRLGWRRSLCYFLVVFAVSAALFLPFASAWFLKNFSGSLGLYFQKLEFNASIYYVLRWVGFQIKGYNVIATLAPALGVAAGLGILALAFFERNLSESFKLSERSALAAGENNLSESFKLSERWSLPETCLFAFCIYLACTTTLHPWYLALPVLLCIFTRWRFPIVWSGMIFLTYVNYSYSPYRENLCVVALEYAVVAGWLIFEWRQK